MRKALLRFSCSLILASTFLAEPNHATAQETGIIQSGNAVVTGFSGTKSPEEALPPGANTLDETFIDPDGIVAEVVDVNNLGGPSNAQLVDAPVIHKIKASEIGQVFGIALDDGLREDSEIRIPNAYFTSTTAHGLQIVIPDSDGDGRPERVKTGQPGAQWMSGQFGVDAGGGPGSVWKVDGLTGQVSLFANIEHAAIPNSGPGLGNIAFDKVNRQFFVSDLDTGMIHRLNMNGEDVGQFDHGENGRPNHGLAAVSLDPAIRMDITDPAFDVEDPETWGFTDPARRVWGLAVHDRRLYYGVWDGPQIWSVGINKDGSFANDARWELDVKEDPKRLPVSDIDFDNQGAMFVAQRGEITSRYDYTRYVVPRKSKVLRYYLETPEDPATQSRWIQEPNEYAIGFPINYRNTGGGIALGPNYDTSGSISGACETTLWSTGDALRNSPVHAAKLLEGGPLNVHGLQATHKDLVRPDNEPPWKTYFIDFDGRYEDPNARGHVGDVEIFKICDNSAELPPDTTPPPGYIPPPDWTPPGGGEIPPSGDDEPELEIKKSDEGVCFPWDICRYTLMVTNNGPGDYDGKLFVNDLPPDGADLIGNSVDWTCIQAAPGELISCQTNASVHLAPGESKSVEIELWMPWFADADLDGYINNCAYIVWGGGDDPWHPGNGPNADLWQKFAVEQKLAMQGFLPFIFVDGIVDGFTANAITNYQIANGLAVTGVIDDALIDHMFPGDAGMAGDADGSNDWHCIDTPFPNDVLPVAGPAPKKKPGPKPEKKKPLQCWSGWKKVSANFSDRGWIVRERKRDNQLIHCAREIRTPPPPPPPLNCWSGWQKVGVNFKKSGWIVRERRRGKQLIYCAKKDWTPPPLECWKGWKEVPANWSRDGWTVRQLKRGKRSIYCARKATRPPLQCWKGWKKVPAKWSQPGWDVRQIRRGRQVIYCAKRTVVVGPVCMKGWKRFSSEKSVPKGWERKRASAGGKTIICARPGKTDPRPVCINGTLSKQFEFGWICSCPKGWKRTPIGNKGGARCDKPTITPISCTGGKVRTQKPSGRQYCDCPRGTKRVTKGHNAFACISDKVCPKGTTGKWPNCRKIPQVCPKGTTGKWPNCRKIPQVCPKGTTGKWPKCRKIPQVCPKGTTGKWPKCRKIPQVCPKGTTGKWPKCRKVPQVCPKGTTGKWPNCRKIPQVCPKGQYRSSKTGKCTTLR